MKILCVIPHYWPNFQYGGTVASAHYLNRALVKKGIDVTVYTTNVGLDDSVTVNQELNIDGVKVTYFGFTKLFEFLGTIGWQFSRHITRALKNNLTAFELVYIVDIWSYPATVAAYYSRLYGKPYVIVPSGMFYPRTFYKKIWKKWPYYHFVIKRDLKEASAIHYTTEDEAEKTHSFLGLKNPAIIIPYGTDLSGFSDLPIQERKDKKIILFLGRIHWIKGLDILIKAYARAAKERQDVHLLIAGNDTNRYAKKVKGWVKEYGIDNRVTFTGMLTGRNKLEAYIGSDIFVLPSYSENFGMAVVEAMACRIPVIISNKVGIHNEIKRNKAGIIINTDPQSLYEAIKLLLDNYELKKEIAANGRKLVEECYDIDKTADKMAEAYREILFSSRRAKVK